jgi:hypothetical protein
MPWPTGKNHCDMVTRVTNRPPRKARRRGAIRAREARPKFPKQQKLRAKRAHGSGERANDKKASKTASKSREFSWGRASRAALRAKFQRVGNQYAAHLLPVGAMGAMLHSACMVDDNPNTLINLVMRSGKHKSELKLPF